MCFLFFFKPPLRHRELCELFGKTMKEYDVTQSAHRRIFMTMILKAADISNITRPFEISRVWGEMITKEFLSQGDTEREQGIDVSVCPASELAESQIGFIEGVGLPMYTLIAEHVPELQPFVGYLEENRDTWKSKLK